MNTPKPNKGPAELYHEAYNKLFAAAPKELQEKIIRNRADGSYFPKEVWAWVRSVAEEAEKNGA
jgi:hypothetical protein